MMKKFLCAVIIVMMFAAASACAKIKPDVDLSKMNGVMAYSGLFNSNVQSSSLRGENHQGERCLRLR